jgi:hypothetical protein
VMRLIPRQLGPFWLYRPTGPPPTGHHMAPCWEQPGKQAWHVTCALRHPVRFLRSRGPQRWRYGGNCA